MDLKKVKKPHRRSCLKETPRSEHDGDVPAASNVRKNIVKIALYDLRKFSNCVAIAEALAE